MEDDKMKSFTVRFPESLRRKAEDKAGMIPFSKILRKLVEMWVRGDIDIDTSRK